MLKKWILILLPTLLIGVTGCASTSDAENQTDNESVTKTSKDCQKNQQGLPKGQNNWESTQSL